MRVAVLTALCALLLPRLVRADEPPAWMLWAWERPEDLRFASPREVGVAFYHSLVRVGSGGVSVLPRRQPLRVSEGTYLEAVVHVERGRVRRALTARDRDHIVDALVAAASAPGVQSVQIDYDATASERAFYRDVLVSARQRLPARTRLTMTALASWCAGDDWLRGASLPVDDIVPMVFTMGRGAGAILDRIRAEGNLPESLCRTSVGVAVHEVVPRVRGARRRYVFNPRPWDGSTWARFTREHPW